MSILNPLSWFRPAKPKQAPRDQVGYGIARRYGINTPPGQSRGILSWLRELTGFGWPGNKNAAGTPAAEYVYGEKARGGPSGVNIPAFLPYIDNYTCETPEMRRVYREMLKDPYVKASLLDKDLDVASQDIHINPPDDHGLPRSRAKRNKEVAAFCHWALSERLHGGIPGLVNTICLHGLVNGYSISEKVWQPEEQHSKYTNKIVLDKLKAKDVDNDVVLDVDEYRNIVGLMGLRYNAGAVFSPADFVIFEYLKMYEIPGGMSDLRAAYSYYWQRDVVIKLRLYGVENRAIPPIWGSYKDQSRLRMLQDTLSKIKSLNWAAVPDDVQLKVLEIAGQSHQVFKETIESLNQDITVSILGAFLQQQTSSGGGDPRGDTKQHRSTVDLQKWFLSAAFLEVVNKQIIPDLVNLNYSGVDMPAATIGGINDQDNLTSAQLDDILVNKLKIPLSLRDAYKRYGRAQPIDPTDAISPQPEQPQGGGFGQPPAMPMGERRRVLTMADQFSEIKKRMGKKRSRAIFEAALELMEVA